MAPLAHPLRPRWPPRWITAASEVMGQKRSWVLPGTTASPALKMRLRIAPTRSVVGIDEFAIEPLRSSMSMGERFIEIACLHALLHYGGTITHKSGYHPIRTIPSQNPFQFRNRLRFHPGLVPKLTDRRSDRCDWAHSHCRKWTDALPLGEHKLLLQRGLRGNWYRYYPLHASKHQAARFVAHPKRDDDKAERVRDQRLKVANGSIRENITLVPCGQPCLYDR